MSRDERLHAAAAKIRQVAPETSTGWYATDILMGDTAVARSALTDHDVHHIVLWSPVVAEAVATWLEAEAEQLRESMAKGAVFAATIELLTGQRLGIDLSYSTLDQALALADAILGEEEREPAEETPRPELPSRERILEVILSNCERSGFLTTKGTVLVDGHRVRIENPAVGWAPVFHIEPSGEVR